MIGDFGYRVLVVVAGSATPDVWRYWAIAQALVALGDFDRRKRCRIELPNFFLTHVDERWEYADDALRRHDGDRRAIVEAHVSRPFAIESPFGMFR